MNNSGFELPQRQQECQQKLEWMRTCLRETGAAGICLRGTDWFAWATTGGSNTVLLTAETGVAEVLVTAQGAWVLTDTIEAQRLQDEELPAKGDLAQEVYDLAVSPWAEPTQRESFVREMTANGKVLSDKPSGSHDRLELPLPASLIQYKRTLLPSESDRYRYVGRLASEAMTEVLAQAKPDWTEHQLAGAGAAALWNRGLHPALTLAAGERRLPIYRHPTASQEPLGRVAMMVFCARGFGLYANLTRFVCFGSLTKEQSELHRRVREIEAAALNQCQANVPLVQIYDTLKQTYEEQDYPKAIYEHHQGGTTGYLAREVVANPTTNDRLQTNMAIAWNPSLPGAKIEDTFVLRDDGSLENLTFEPNWPSVEVAGRSRPLPLEIT
uniref:M24 family metallopeptidase n=1 Tax=Trichocoleus desertorum TaxID=1481672 RepID=UPI0025B45ADF|nr:M24 family metallopeptidase [Trichocoleus desertorum]